MFKNLLSKKMDRKEFFVYVGLFFIMFLGIDAFLKNFFDINIVKNKKGFGHGPYGI